MTGIFLSNRRLCRLAVRPVRRLLSRVGVTAILWLTFSGTLSARPPEIRNISLRGFQIGAATSVIIDGVDLLPAPQLFLDERKIDAVVDAASTPTRLTLSVPLPESTTPGIAQLRLATAEGVSNTVLVGLDRLPQVPLTEELPSAQVAAHGTVPGSGISKAKFPGQAGQEILIEVEARRLGSKLRPVVHLYDSKRVQLGWGVPVNSLAGDTRIILKLPKDDHYVVEVHDLQYAPPGPSYFRLKIGQWQFADLVFPPAVPAGKDVTVELLGNLPTAKFPMKVDGGDLVAVVNPLITSGLPPTLAVSQMPEVIETGEQSMSLGSVPVAVSGRLNAVGQRDRFQLPVVAGQKLLLEVFADRIGSRMDSMLELRNAQGVVLASNDDAAGTTDSRLEFTVPANTELLEVQLRDQLETARDDAIYRLIILPADQPTRSFEAVIKSDVINVADGESAVVEVLTQRAGYDGPIQLQVEGVPPGVEVSGTEIPAQAQGTLLTFSSRGGLPATVVTRIVARSADGALFRRVRAETTPDDRSPAWLRERVALGATPKSPTAFQLALANENPVAKLVMAAKINLPIKVTRPPGQLGPVRLTLVTGQSPPRINGQPNLNLTLRAERPVELPVDNAVLAAGNAFNAIDKQYQDAVKQSAAAQGDAKVAADKKVDDLKTQRAAAETNWQAAEAKAVYQADYSVVVPSQLPDASCDLSVRAELLNPERNQVLRTTYLPVRRLAVINPLALTVDGGTAIETNFDEKTGAVIKLIAKVQRQENFQGDVTVTFTGQPPGVSVANGVVKADQTEFTTDLRIPPNFAGTELVGIKLTATGPPDPLSGNLPVKSPELELKIKLNRPAK